MLTLVIAIAEGQDQKHAADVLLEPGVPPIQTSEQLAAAKPDWQAFLVQRNLDYVFDCCAIPAEEDLVCVMTDHQ